MPCGRYTAPDRMAKGPREPKSRICTKQQDRHCGGRLSSREHYPVRLRPWTAASHRYARRPHDMPPSASPVRRSPIGRTTRSAGRAERARRRLGCRRRACWSCATRRTLVYLLFGHESGVLSSKRAAAMSSKGPHFQARLSATRRPLAPTLVVMVSR